MSEIVNNLDAAKAVPVLLNEIDAIKAQLVELETKKLSAENQLKTCLDNKSSVSNKRKTVNT